MAYTMKSARLFAAGDIRLQDEPIPVPAPGEALVRLGAVGICGSDLHWFDEAGIGDARLEQPLVLGHEMAGWTETGQLVAIEPTISCGKCEFCQEGNPNLCPSHRFAGHGSVDGGLRQFISWPEHCLFPLPAAFSAADGAMLEPLGVAMYTLELCHIRPGDTVGIFGCGPIGLLIAQLALRSSAAWVAVTERLPHRLAMAEALGIQHTLLADGKEVESIHSLTRRRGLDIVIEAAGDNAAVDAALETVKPGGQVLLVGIPPDDRTSLNASLVRRKGLSLQWVRRMKHTYPRAISLVQRGVVDVRKPVTQTFSLEQVRQAFDTAARREGMKIVISI